MGRKPKTTNKYYDFRAVINRIGIEKEKTKETLVEEHGLETLAKPITTKTLTNVMLSFYSVEEPIGDSNKQMFIGLDKITAYRKTKSMAFQLSVTFNADCEDLCLKEYYYADTGVDNVNDAIDFIYDRVVDLFMDNINKIK